MKRTLQKFFLLGWFILSIPAVQGEAIEEEVPAKKKIRQITTYYPANEEPSEVRVIYEIRVFNPVGQVTSIKRYFSNGNLKEEWQITYGKKGEMKEIHSWSYAKGYHEILQRFQFRRGKKITATFFYRNGFLEEETHIVYRKKRPSTQYVYNGFGKLKGEREVSYDGKEILILRPQDEPFEGKIETEYYE